jgi:hypothetical protein
MALQALVDAAIDFCEETNVIQLTLDPVQTVLNDSTYNVALPTDTEIARVVAVWHGTRELDLVAPNAVGSPLAYFPSIGADNIPSGAPASALLSTRGVLTIYPAPDAQALKMLTVRVATRPARTATTVDDTLWYDWAEALVAGAALRVASQGGQPYSSDVEAVRSTVVYRALINRAKRESYMGRVVSNTSVRMRPFA